MCVALCDAAKILARFVFLGIVRLSVARTGLPCQPRLASGFWEH